MPIGPRARARLAELAQSKELARLEFDGDGLIQLDLGDFVVGVLSREERGCFYFFAYLEAPPGAFAAPTPVSQFDERGPVCRRSRLTTEISTGARVLVAEQPSEALPYQEFVRSLEDFVAAVERARPEPPTGYSSPRPSGTLPADDLHWIRS